MNCDKDKADAALRELKERLNEIRSRVEKPQSLAEVRRELYRLWVAGKERAK